MNASEYAERTGYPYQTVARWLKQNLIPGVQTVEAGKIRVYLIPESALEFQRPKIGRPTKEATEAKQTGAKKPAAKSRKPSKKAAKRSE